MAQTASRQKKTETTNTPRPRRLRLPEKPPKPVGLPTLYLDVVGALVLQEGCEFRVAPFAQEFIDAIRGRFEVVFLTSLSEPAALNIGRHLDIEFEYGIYRKGLGKVTGIDFKKAFFWVEHTPTPRDLMRLAEERRSGHLIAVNGKEGVTRATLEKLDRVMQEIYG